MENVCSEKGDVIERTQRNISKYAADFSSRVRVRKHRYWIPPLEHPERDPTHDSSKQRKKIECQHMSLRILKSNAMLRQNRMSKILI